MAIKLHGLVGSPATFRAMATLYEKNLEFEFVPVDFATKEHKSPNFLALNPFGQVPVLEDGDIKLFESRAIAKYVSEVYASKGTSLKSKYAKKAAIEAVWMEVEGQKYEPICSKLAWELIFKPMFGMTTDDTVVAEYEQKLADLLDVYEAHLDEYRYLGGNTFSLADLFHLPLTQALMGTKVKSVFDAHKNVSRWALEILSRDAWTKVTAMLQK